MTNEDLLEHTNEISNFGQRNAEARDKSDSTNKKERVVSATDRSVATNDKRRPKSKLIESKEQRDNKDLPL